MKKINIVSIILILIGLGLFFYLNYGPCPSTDYASCGLSRGMLTILVAYPLIIGGILLLFSGIGAIIFFIGILVYFLISILDISILSMSGLIILIIGLVYALIEGIIKLVKFIKNKLVNKK